MHTPIRKYYIIPGTVEEWMRRVQEGFVPLISQVPGFQAYYALKVREDEAVPISTLDTQAGAEETVRRAAVWVANNLATLNQGLSGYNRIPRQVHPTHGACCCLCQTSSYRCLGDVRSYL